jgi:hypothetical protein
MAVTAYRREAADILQEFQQGASEGACSVRSVRSVPTKVPTEVLATSSNFVEGEDIQYFSKSSNKWRVCKILKVGADGQVEVSLKPGHRILPYPGNVRKLPPKVPATPATVGNLVQGEDVEYFSKSVGKWRVCKILEVAPNGEVQVNIKPGHWIHPFPGNLRKLPAKALASTGSARMLETPIGFVEGEDVEYLSRSTGKWHGCKISRVGSGGLVEVSLKLGHWIQPSPDNLRKPPARVGATSTGFAEGEDVEYCFKSTGKWYVCKILKVGADGQVKVSVKPGQWIEPSPDIVRKCQ